MRNNRYISAGSGGFQLGFEEVDGVNHVLAKLVCGESGEINDVSATQPLPMLDFFVASACGLLPRFSTLTKFGINPAVGTSGFYDLWDGGAEALNWLPPTTARIHEVSSNNVNDDVGGSGAEEIRIFGLDNSYQLQQEVVELDGTSIVLTDLAYRMIYRMRVIKANNGDLSGTNIGRIRAVAQVDDTVTAQVNPGNNITHMAIYQVPANHTAVAFDFLSSEVELKNALIGFRPLVALEGEPFADIFATTGPGTSAFVMSQRVPHTLPAKSIIKVQSDSDKVGSSVAMSFSMVLYNYG